MEPTDSQRVSENFRDAKDSGYTVTGGMNKIPEANVVTLPEDVVTTTSPPIIVDCDAILEVSTVTVFRS